MSLTVHTMCFHKKKKKDSSHPIRHELLDFWEWFSSQLVAHCYWRQNIPCGYRKLSPEINFLDVIKKPLFFKNITQEFLTAAPRNDQAHRVLLFSSFSSHHWRGLMFSEFADHLHDIECRTFVCDTNARLLFFSVLQCVQFCFSYLPLLFYSISSFSKLNMPPSP